MSEFSFEKRQFGQYVTVSHIVALIQTVEGVEATKVEYLYLTEAYKSYQERIPSQIAHWDDVNAKVVADELITINAATTGGKAGERGIVLTEITGGQL